MSDEIVIVHSLFVGSGTPGIHIVLVPCHVPTSFARRSCILPGVPATMQAFMSSSVQPGGSFISARWNPRGRAVPGRILRRLGDRDDGGQSERCDERRGNQLAKRHDRSSLFGLVGELDQRLSPRHAAGIRDLSVVNHLVQGDQQEAGADRLHRVLETGGTLSGLRSRPASPIGRAS
jgi:hypothetical protein